jgi:diketogulonate reductase-like aldo/keto reductase
MSLEAKGKRRNYNPVQLTLAWLLQKSPVMLPIPGTANIADLEQNIAVRAEVNYGAECRCKNAAGRRPECQSGDRANLWLLPAIID